MPLDPEVAAGLMSVLIMMEAEERGPSNMKIQFSLAQLSSCQRANLAAIEEAERS